MHFKSWSADAVEGACSTCRLRWTLECGCRFVVLASSHVFASRFDSLFAEVAGSPCISHLGSKKRWTGAVHIHSAGLPLTFSKRRSWSWLGWSWRFCCGRMVGGGGCQGRGDESCDPGCIICFAAYARCWYGMRNTASRWHKGYMGIKGDGCPLSRTEPFWVSVQRSVSPQYKNKDGSPNNIGTVFKPEPS